MIQSPHEDSSFSDWVQKYSAVEPLIFGGFNPLMGVRSFLICAGTVTI